MRLVVMQGYCARLNCTLLSFGIQFVALRVLFVGLGAIGSVSANLHKESEANSYSSVPRNQDASRVRFIQNEQPIQEPIFGPILGDINPPPYPVINLHVDIPNNDPLEKRREMQERAWLRHVMNDHAEDTQRGFNDFTRVQTAQFDSMAQLVGLAEATNRVFEHIASQSLSNGHT